MPKSKDTTTGGDSSTNKSPTIKKAAKRKRKDDGDGSDSDDDDSHHGENNNKRIAAAAPEKEDETGGEATMPVYYPDFFPEIQQLSQDELKAKDWLTPELRKEIEDYFPTENDIQGPDGVRKKEALAKNMEELFCVNRKFLSWKQLQMSLSMFSQPWGFNASHTNSKFICSFGKKTVGNGYVSKGLRKRGPSAKELIQCPFEIRYAYCGYGRVARFEKLPSLRYQIKITGADYNHTCGLSPAARQLALRMSKKLGAPKEKKDAKEKPKPNQMGASEGQESLTTNSRAAGSDPPTLVTVDLAALRALQTRAASAAMQQPPKKKRPDRSSRFRLDAYATPNFPQTNPQQPVLQVEAPVKNGDFTWLIGFATGNNRMETVTYDRENLSGVAHFVNGFLATVMGGTATHKLELKEPPNRTLCQWWLPINISTSRGGEDPTQARFEVITGALRTLLTEDSSAPPRRATRNVVEAATTATLHAPAAAPRTLNTPAVAPRTLHNVPAAAPTTLNALPAATLNVPAAAPTTLNMQGVTLNVPPTAPTLNLGATQGLNLGGPPLN